MVKCSYAQWGELITVGPLDNTAADSVTGCILYSSISAWQPVRKQATYVEGQDLWSNSHQSSLIHPRREGLKLDQASTPGL